MLKTVMKDTIAPNKSLLFVIRLIRRFSLAMMKKTSPANAEVTTSWNRPVILGVTLVIKSALSRSAKGMFEKI